MLVDANILIYAYHTGSPYHGRMKSWLDGTLNGVPKAGLPWASLLAFARIVTNPRVFEKPATVDAAWTQVLDWTRAPAAWIPHPTEEHAEVIRRILRKVSVHANDIPDLHLAALAIEHGLRICSTDSGFSRYPDLRWVNPLVET